MDREFDIKDLVEKARLISVAQGDSNDQSNEFDEKQFIRVVKVVQNQLDQIEAEELKEEKMLLRQRDAILGNPNAVEYYKAKISDIINDKNFRKERYPQWYTSLEEAVYHEVYGLFGISEWLNSDKYKESDACMIIGDNVFFEANGEPELQKQKISRENRDRMKETLLLVSPRENRAAAKHEIYSHGKRVTVFNDNGLTKDGQDCIIFRKYHVDKFTFEEQVAKHTIPEDSIPFFKSLVQLGFNVAFTGPVKSAKTTFLTTYQSYENPRLPALSIETDPEIDFHMLMPESPIIQFVPNKENEDTVIERAKRSDAKYIVVGEARSGKWLHLAVECANMGTKRMKVSIHLSETVDFCHDVAEKITREVGGNILAYMIKTAKTFQYVFNFITLASDQSQKRLSSLWEIRLNDQKMEISMHQICKYIDETDSWVWAYDIGKDKEKMAMRESKEAYAEFQEALKKLAADHPNPDGHVFVEPYMKVLLRGGGGFGY
ncbi:MAG: hypothetical protein PHE79_11250 [Eubacteriales bacterium]|nr:hypothetical protein [Eubacteriales bacterium]